MSDKAEKNYIIIVRETILQSWLIDASTFALFVGLIGAGVYLQSSAMQWAGMTVAFVTCLAMANNRRRKMTRAEAIKFLQEPGDA